MTSSREDTSPPDYVESLREAPPRKAISEESIVQMKNLGTDVWSKLASPKMSFLSVFDFFQEPQYNGCTNTIEEGPAENVDGLSGRRPLNSQRVRH